MIQSFKMAKKSSSDARRLGKRAKAWTNYEEVARYVLQQLGKRFGLADVEGKQKVSGRQSGTKWEIDAKGVRDGDASFVIVECRRYGKRLNQEALAAVAYRILDTGATGGITVSPHPLQRGAAKVARASQIEHVQLRSDSTRELWVAEIKKVIHVGITEVVGLTVRDSFTITVIDADGNVVEQRSG
ncbi:restriction endonuclease [Acidisphaera rubrifaciens]|nr:restriction endonuclease [Acidisphaera rubrifaciens]